MPHLFLVQTYVGIHERYVSQDLAPDLWCCFFSICFSLELSTLYKAINISWVRKEYCLGIGDRLNTSMICWVCTKCSISSWPPNKKSATLSSDLVCAEKIPQNKNGSKAEKPALKWPMVRWLKQGHGFEPGTSTSLMTYLLPP